MPPLTAISDYSEGRWQNGHYSTNVWEDGFPKMDLAELLSTDEGRARIHELAARVSADPHLRERMRAILEQPGVRQRLLAMQDDVIEKPAIWGSLLRAMGHRP